MAEDSRKYRRMVHLPGIPPRRPGTFLALTDVALDGPSRDFGFGFRRLVVTHAGRGSRAGSRPLRRGLPSPRNVRRAPAVAPPVPPMRRPECPLPDPQSVPADRVVPIRPSVTDPRIAPAPRCRTRH